MAISEIELANSEIHDGSVVRQFPSTLSPQQEIGLIDSRLEAIKIRFGIDAGGRKTPEYKQEVAEIVNRKNELIARLRSERSTNLAPNPRTTPPEKRPSLDTLKDGVISRKSHITALIEAARQPLDSPVKMQLKRRITLAVQDHTEANRRIHAKNKKAYFRNKAR